MNPRSTAERATVYVIAAHNAVRDSLGLLFEAHAVPVRTYASGDAFLRDLPAVANGCLIVDVNWRSPKIAEFLRVLDARQVAMPAVILDDRVMVGMRGNRAGILILQKTVAPDELLRRVVQAIRGGLNG